MSDGQSDAAAMAEREERSREFLNLFTRLLDGEKRGADAFSSDLFNDDKFKQEWDKVLRSNNTPQEFYDLVCKGDETAWGLLLGKDSQHSRWWRELKEMSPFKDCVAITCGYFRGEHGSERFRIITRDDLERCIEGQVKDHKVPGALGEQYVLFLPLKDGSGTTVYLGRQKSGSICT